MSEISQQLNLIYIGWFLGLISSTIIPFIVDYIKNFIYKRRFKKIVNNDVYSKLEDLRSAEQRIIHFEDGDGWFHPLGEDLDYLINTFEGMIREQPWGLGLGYPNEYDNHMLQNFKNFFTIGIVDMDFYTENYSKLLDYFGRKNNYIKFYQAILMLNSVAEVMEEYPVGIQIFKDKYGDIRKYFINYCENLRNTIAEGEILIGERNLFDWNEIPGNDSFRFIEFLKQKFGIDWVKTAKIEKNDDGKTIRLSTEMNFLSLKLNDEKTKAILAIGDVYTYDFIAKAENWTAPQKVDR